ncbi:hypothetical protein HMPREF0454_04049 [Hafnia alvei ATCC 51873]|uniref:Uncharacterized protein n=1 Tax=Hafnia alvei ATCC 51873 TaxID=1002364 RepID=G9YBM0_HAFAL|nr:hypothetical protein HMPREF0454_04049 [Hafnia alvei ATCC 51873]
MISPAIISFFFSLTLQIIKVRMFCAWLACAQRIDMSTQRHRYLRHDIAVHP